MKVSIIIPVYNTEKFIKRCMGSCVRQDLSANDYEIIVINDGSTDNSLSLIEEFSNDYPNIVIRSQKNSGLSEARNSGLNIAQGDFIVFLDSDDWIADNCIKTIVDHFEKDGLDLLKIAAANVFGDRVVRRYNIDNNKIFSGIDLLERGIDFCAPFTVYRKSFLDKYNLRFKPGVFHEDNDFTPRAYFYANKVGCINNLVYYVYQSPNSITRSINPQKAYDAIDVSESLSRFSKDFVGRERKIFDNIIGATINVSLHNTLQMNRDEVSAYKSFLTSHRTVFNHLKSCKSLIYRIEGYAMSLLPGFIPELYKIMIFFDFRKIK